VNAPGPALRRGSGGGWSRDTCGASRWPRGRRRRPPGTRRSGSGTARWRPAAGRRETVRARHRLAFAARASPPRSLTTVARTSNPAATRKSRLSHAQRCQSAASTARRRPRGGTDAHHREQALSLLLRVDVVGEPPELRDDHHVEDGEEGEERDAHGQPERGQDVEPAKHATKTGVTMFIRRRRGTRLASRPYSGTTSRSRTAAAAFV